MRRVSPALSRVPLRVVASLVCAICTSIACDPTLRSSDSEATQAGSDPILATVDETVILASAVDAPLILEIHDLEIAKFTARRDRLNTLIQRQIGSSVPVRSPEWDERVTINLTRPTSPRLKIPNTLGPTRGASDAVVTIVEFLDFQSSHSRRLQPELIRILDRYPDWVKLEIRDLPLPYHRYARDAAAMAHCAGAQGAYWNYHDMLLLEQPSLQPFERPAYATRLGLDASLIESCVESRTYENRIDVDIALAAKIGVRRAATVFVNGLYLSGHPSGNDLDRIVREELLRLGLDPKAGRAEASARSTLKPPPHGPRQSRAREKRRAALPAIPEHQIGPPEIVISMTRAEVDYALEDRRSLDLMLDASRAEFSGQRLLTVGEVSEGDFLARLGLESQDVLMILNGEFLTLEHNWLWDAFETNETVSLLFMRNGLPHTVEYQIR